MALIDSIFKFIGTKWFSLVLGIILICVLPATYHNFDVVLKAGQMSQFWYLVAVFFINVISIGLCAYKFMSLHHKPKQTNSEEW